MTPKVLASAHSVYGVLPFCPCDQLMASEGTIGFLDTVEDMPNWTAWFGSWLFVPLLHRAIKARLEAAHG